MRIAYFCALTQLDTDLSFLQEAQKICDITAFIYVNPKHFNKSIIKLEKLYDRSGIFDSSIYPEFFKFGTILDLNKIKIINIAQEKYWQFRAFKIHSSLIKKLNKEFDIIHITSILQPPEFPLYKLRNKLVLTVHDPIAHSSSNSLKYKLARRLSMSIIKNFIIFNHAQEQEFRDKYNLNKSQVLVSNFGIFPWMRLINDNKNNPENSKIQYVLFAGRISAYKGIDYLLSAFLKVHEKFPNIKLIIAGSGNFHFDISQWQKLPYIEFRNRFIPDEELIQLIQNSLFVVCPYTDATQSGVVMSSFTFCKPVLATNVGGLPEMINNGRHGLIVKEKNVDALVNGINKMLEDPIQLNIYSNNIRQDYNMGDKSWKKISSQIIEFYNELL